jgi:coenzyme F420-0:L-glutamate ligase/coenzyme F420-1:gamma-L-glutamate ligase
MTVPRLEFVALREFPSVQAGDSLPELIVTAIGQTGMALQAGDVVVVTQKVVSKAEGRLIRLADVVPAAAAEELAKKTSQDPALVQLILDESSEVLRSRRDLIIVLHRLGLVIGNAGVDQSNVPEGYALLLPLDPDASARRIRERLSSCVGGAVAVIISDSMGRFWRNGTVGHAIGVAGMDPIVDLRGTTDLFGRRLRRTRIGAADAFAAAATLLMGEADEGTPVVVIRGYQRHSEHVGIEPLLRTREHELFR